MSTEEIHGHGAVRCTYCWNPETCDCPCTSCIHYRHSFAASDYCTCGCMEPRVYDSDDDYSSCGTNDRPEDDYEADYQEMAYAGDYDDGDGAPEERYEDTGEYWK